MKTNALITRKTALNTLIVFLGLIITSCGSYQNSSYYDSDGIYSTNGEKVVVKNNENAQTSVQYKQYFNSLQSTGGSSDEIFTDVNSYGSDYNVENDSIQAPSTGYASWGSSPQETIITVYPDSYWSVGFGWGYPYYGYGYSYGYPYYGYGWGYPHYGWGYPSYGWDYPGYGYPGYGYATPYSYNHSRRGSSYAGTYNNGSYTRNYNARNNAYSRNNSYTRSNTYNRSSNYNRNSTSISRQSPTFTNRNSSSTTRNYSQNQSRSNSNYTQNRTNTSSQSSQRSSYTPSSNSSYRSSGSNMSSGTRSSGGGGGGRVSGGGGRR
nr:hypothetical protein [uncultured Flavobacterium sp.]